MLLLMIIVITAFANLADVLLKIGANSAGESLSDPFAILLTPWIWLGAILGICSMAMWVYVLGRHHISHAYPIFVALGFLNISLASWLYFKEDLTSWRIFGIILIVAGIAVVHFKTVDADDLTKSGGLVNQSDEAAAPPRASEGTV